MTRQCHWNQNIWVSQAIFLQAVDRPHQSQGAKGNAHDHLDIRPARPRQKIKVAALRRLPRAALQPRAHLGRRFHLHLNLAQYQWSGEVAMQRPAATRDERRRELEALQARQLWLTGLASTSNLASGT